MYRDHCYHALDYAQEIDAFADSRTLAAADRIIQAPFVLVVRIRPWYWAIFLPSC